MYVFEVNITNYDKVVNNGCNSKYIEKIGTVLNGTTVIAIKLKTIVSSLN